MTGAHYVVASLKNSLDYKGRAPRVEFWYLFLFIFVSVLFGDLVDDQLGLDPLTGFAILIQLILLVPGITVSIRRLHDVGRSGWWLLVSVVPLLGILLLLYWFVQPSKTEDNPYRLASA